MRRPLSGVPPITQVFGSTAIDYSQFGLNGHHGVDYGVGIGTPVYAPENARVLQSANGVTDPKSGRFAAGETLVLSGTYEHWLMHLNGRLVSVGQIVTEGQLIGYTGNTGYTTGPHLHWGTRPLNPNMSNGYRGFVNPGDVLFNQPAPQPATGGYMTPMTEAREAQLYLQYLGRHKEFAGASGRTEQKWFADAQGEILVNITSRRELEGKVANLVGQVQNLQKQVNELGKRPTQAQLDTLKAVADAATTQSKADRKRAEELRDELKTAQSQPVQNEKEVVQNWLVRLWNSTFKK